jgi:hypothetical protein
MGIRRCFVVDFVRRSVIVAIAIMAVLEARVERPDLRRAAKDEEYVKSMTIILKGLIDRVSMEDPELRKSQIDALERRIAELGQVQDVEEMGSEVHIIRYVDVERKSPLKAQDGRGETAETDTGSLARAPLFRTQ